MTGLLNGIDSQILFSLHLFCWNSDDRALDKRVVLFIFVLRGNDDGG